MPNRPESSFPKGFLWGAVTSAHQYEGGLHNQWTVWELENAKALASQSSYQYDDLAVWPHIKSSAKSPANYISDRAANGYELYQQDIALARMMHFNALRLSIEWSRIQPEEGAWNAEAIAHYRQQFIAMKKNGIEPVVTLFHYTLPLWFAEKGGFEKRANARYFVEYVQRLLHEIGSGMRYIVTLNEPQTYVEMSYLHGKWPPQVVSKRRAYTVLANLVYTHRKVAEVIHADNRRFRVGVAKNYTLIYPGDDAWLSERSADAMRMVQNGSFLRRVAKHSDFIGINYKGSQRVYGYRVHNPDNHMSDVDAQMDPDNLAHVLQEVHDSYHLPIMVTASGVADHKDEYRKWWLAQNVIALRTALQNGVAVIGCMVYSLTDQFEWDRGFWPRYGLAAVDYATMKRTPRPSAVWYAKVMKKLKE
jgi:beta-glucosidase